jgi:hypothetical protein
MLTRMAILATAGSTADMVDMVAATAAVVRMAAVAEPIRAESTGHRIRPPSVERHCLNWRPQSGHSPPADMGAD